MDPKTRSRKPPRNAEVLYSKQVSPDEELRLSRFTRARTGETMIELRVYWTGGAKSAGADFALAGPGIELPVHLWRELQLYL